MTVRIFRSTDVGAPAISTAVGTLITVLDAVLVHGYGSGLDVKTPLGWTKEFSGVNRAVYKSGAGSLGTYYYVGDYLAGYAKFVGFESMTAIETGTGQFPAQQLNQASGSSRRTLPHIAKNTAWMIVGDETCFHLFVGTAGSYYGAYIGDITSYIDGSTTHSAIVASSALGTTGTGTTGSFIDLTKNVAADNSTFTSALSVSTLTAAQHSYGSSRNGYMAYSIGAAPSVALSASGLCQMGSVLMRHPSHLVSGGIPIFAVSPIAQLSSSSSPATPDASAMYFSAYSGRSGGSPTPYPMQGGGIMLDRFRMMTDAVAPFYEVGHLKGVWFIKHTNPLANGTTFTGSGDLAGKTFEIVTMTAGGSVAIETSNTW
jgi:hypothetical protein